MAESCMIGLSMDSRVLGFEPCEIAVSLKLSISSDFYPLRFAQRSLLQRSISSSIIPSHLPLAAKPIRFSKPHIIQIPSSLLFQPQTPKLPATPILQTFPTLLPSIHLNKTQPIDVMPHPRKQFLSGTNSIIIFVTKGKPKTMKQALSSLPQNAFLKVKVGHRERRLYLRDVRQYGKRVKPHLPPIPTFYQEIEWNKSAITDCGCEAIQEQAGQGRRLSI